MPTVVQLTWRFLTGFTKFLLRFLLVAVVLVTVAATVLIQRGGDPSFRPADRPPVVNDITGLNPIPVARELRPRSVDEVSAAIRSSTGPISIGGGRFSQGGQVAYPGSLHLDMRSLNRILSIDRDAKQIRVQAGATWRDIQEAIDPQDLSVRIMQTYSNFTVGGSLGVNVHGRYIGEGPLIRSVENIRIVLADGAVVTASRDENPEIFFGAIGGYGGLGVVVEATLSLADNKPIERRVQVMPVTGYREHFFRNIRTNPDVVLSNADIYPPDYEEARDVSWHVTDQPLTNEDRLIARDEEYEWQPRLADFVSSFRFGTRIRQYLLDPLYYVPERIVWRNWEASYDVAELEPASREEHTYGLREYFVPVDRFDEFVPRMRAIFQRHDANILNVSIRHANPDPGSLLAWADREVFAFVVYYRQGTSRAEREAVGAWSVDMIDAVLESGGSYYLPYQIFASPAQFEAAYPRAPQFYALKARLDPANRFRNELWQAYYPPNRDALAEDKARVAGYYRGEEQTFLTVPEWYLVFNPGEYADYLESGRDPSVFPFFASIDEYWSLYDRALATVSGLYPPNDEYLTMLKVIGVSTTVEYLVKGAYEATIGRATRWLAHDQETPEDLLIRKAHRAYSLLIYDEPWYRFRFLDWVREIWRLPLAADGSLVRRLERRLFFSLEFILKAGYAKVIGAASQATYGATEKEVFLTATAPPGATVPPGTRLLASQGNDQLLSVPRWGGFSEVVPVLARAGYDFRDVSGNDEIVASLIIPAGLASASFPGRELYRSRVVSDDRSERVVLAVPVPDLREFIAAVAGSAARLEHLYDY